MGSSIQISLLIAKLESYLSGELSHDEIAEYSWSLADDVPELIPEENKEYWSCIFSIIHLADETHFQDGCTQKELRVLLEKLKQSNNCSKNS